MSKEKAIIFVKWKNDGRDSRSLLVTGTRDSYVFPLFRGSGTGVLQHSKLKERRRGRRKRMNKEKKTQQETKYILGNRFPPCRSFEDVLNCITAEDIDLISKSLIIQNYWGLSILAQIIISAWYLLYQFPNIRQSKLYVVFISVFQLSIYAWIIDSRRSETYDYAMGVCWTGNRIYWHKHFPKNYVRSQR